MLLQLNRKAASVVLKQFDASLLLASLAEAGFRGLLYSLQKQAADFFSAPLESAVAYPDRYGDIYLTADDQLLYLKWSAGDDDGDPFSDPGREKAGAATTFEIGMIASLSVADPQVLDGLCAAVNDALTSLFDSKAPKWKITPAEGHGGALADAAVAPKPSNEEMEIASALSEPKLAPFLEALKKKNGEIILDNWLEGRKDGEEIEYFIDKLFEVDLFDEEIVVYSQQTGQPVFRAKDRVGLETLKQAGVRDITGNELDMENVWRYLILPKEKQIYIGKGWAARIHLLALLHKIGLAPASIFDLEPVNGAPVIAAWFDGKPLVFILGDQQVSDEDFAMLSVALQRLDDPTVAVLSAEAIDLDAAKAAGAGTTLHLTNLDEFNTTLLDKLAADRLEAIKAIIQGFDGMLSLKLSEMTMARFKDEA